MQCVLTIVAERVIVITYSIPSSSRESKHEKDGVRGVEGVLGIYLVKEGTKLGRSRVNVKNIVMISRFLKTFFLK